MQGNCACGSCNFCIALIINGNISPRISGNLYAIFRLWWESRNSHATRIRGSQNLFAPTRKFLHVHITRPDTLIYLSHKRMRDNIISYLYTAILTAGFRILVFSGFLVVLGVWVSGFESVSFWNTNSHRAPGEGFISSVPREGRCSQNLNKIDGKKHGFPPLKTVN